MDHGPGEEMTAILLEYDHILIRPEYRHGLFHFMFPCRGLITRMAWTFFRTGAIMNWLAISNHITLAK